jgi:hypothetical protein
MLHALLIQGRLSKIKIGEKLISIRIDGGDVFVECRTSDFVQIKEKIVLFFYVDVHYCAHKTNFVVQNLLILSIVLKLEDLFQSLHSYFT